ncbi:MAG: hypothetical protein ISN28_14570 [Ectothiorhodospiraceae bacterium AqS1]|nr:hypothetical protein [Ectothiorhodospiraceae bacterium AqS1]
MILGQADIIVAHHLESISNGAEYRRSRIVDRGLTSIEIFSNRRVKARIDDDGIGSDIEDKTKQ